MYKIAVVIALVLVFLTRLPVDARVGVTVNGNEVNFSAVPVIRAGRVFVPLRSVFEQLGAGVVYSNGTIHAKANGCHILLRIGSTQATVNGQPQTIDVAPFIIGARTYVPLRFVSQALGDAGELPAVRAIHSSLGAEPAPTAPAGAHPIPELARSERASPALATPSTKSAGLAALPNIPAVAEPVATAPSISARAASDNLGQRAPLSLVVNGVSKGDVIGIVRMHDVLLRDEDARSAGVPFRAHALIALGGGLYVSLGALAPSITYVLDLTTVTLKVTVDPALLPRTTIALDGSAQARAEVARAVPSGFLTYSLTSDTANLGGGSAFVQAGATAGAGLVTFSGSYANGDLRRGLLAYEADSEAHLNRLTFGDQLVSSDVLGGSTVLGGIGISRHFEFEPEYAYFPTPGLSGTVLGPTTAEVYVNGTLLRSVQLAPGNFNLSNIPVPQGAGVTQIVLRDAQGNSQTLNGAFYQTRALLRPGLTDYDYGIGFARPNPFGKTDVYGPLTGIGSYRIGLSPSLTAGGRVERWLGSVGGGPQLDVGLPIGHLSLASSLSRTFGVSGSATAAAYDYGGRHFSLGLSALTQSANYATPSLGPFDQRTRSSLSQNLSFPVFKTAMLALSHTASSSTSLPAASEFLASLNLPVPRHQAYMSVTLERDNGGSILGLAGSRPNASWRIGTELSLLVAKALNVSASTSSAAGSNSSTIQIAKSAPNGPGLGYQVGATGGAEQSAAGQIDYHTQYGNVEALSNVTGSGGAAPTVTMNGSLVGFKQGLFFTQPVSSAYALAQVPGFRNMAIYSGGQYAGRTDGRDAMIVSNLSAYYDNSIKIDQLLDRLDLIVDESTIKVRPRNLAGVVANFSMRRFHAYTGRIITRRNGKSHIPVLGALALSRAGHVVSSDLGSQGQFYVDNLEPGMYAATVTDDDGSCSFKLDLPIGAEGVPVTALGTLTCEAPS